jgi:hypothetical protein
VGKAFQRSRRFGIIGVVVVAVLAAVIGLAFGQSGNPTIVMAVILALVFGYVAILLTLQRRDLDTAARRDALGAAAPAGAVDDPTTPDQTALLNALAIKPVDAEALAGASGRVWALGRSSINSGAVIMVLIFCAVVPWQLFQAYWSLIVFVPLIVGYAIFLVVRMLRPGGELDRAYDDSAATLEPLGLRLTERPQVEMHKRLDSPLPRHEVVGGVAYAGQRHGRQVAIRIEGGSQTTLSGSFERFRVRAARQRLHAEAGAPPAVVAVVDALPRSACWTGIAASGGPDGIAVGRKRGGGEHWMRDLWLAERLADAAGTRAA